MKKKINKRELSLLLIWVIIIGVIVGDSLARNISLKFSRLKEELNVNDEKLFRLNAILKQSKEVNSEYDKIFTGYKEIADSESLLAQVQSISSKARVNIFNIKPAQSSDEGLYKVYTLKIEGQDEISAFARFLNALSQELKGISVERIQVNAQNKEELPKVSLLINAVAFKE